ncbi:hypothetical protein [Streptomyces sp. NPDC015350]|uniref:hypothetical protein n=1 Tax=Streptomyces sp. NPDC015350 TaxID=3364955 RepID=UPI0036F73E9F
MPAVSLQRLHAPPGGQAAWHQVLWQIDETAHHSTLLILGFTRPDLTHLVEQADAGQQTLVIDYEVTGS